MHGLSVDFIVLLLNAIHIRWKFNLSMMPVSCRLVAISLLAFGLFIAGCCTSEFPPPPGSPANQTLPPAGRTAPHILTTVPDVRQSTPYSCGASSLQAVLGYWGRDISENELLALLNSTGERGTPPGTIVNASLALGFPAEIRTDMTLPGLESVIDAGIPVIVGTWTWRNISPSPLWVDDRNYGHYMVVIGMDDGNVYLEDPAVLGSREVMSRDQFLERWQDRSAEDIRDPGAMTCRRVAVFIRGPAPAGSSGITAGTGQGRIE